MACRLFTIAAVVAGLALAGCETTATEDGALIGGALGAGTGAIIGHQTGHAGEGALIGAGIGALTGAIVGDAVGDTQKPVYVAPAPPPPPPQPVVRPMPPPRPAPAPPVAGHYENRLVVTPSGDMYEQRIWVPHY